MHFVYLIGLHTFPFFRLQYSVVQNSRHLLLILDPSHTTRHDDTGIVATNTATRSTIEERRGCNNFVPVLRGNGTKIAPTGDIFDPPPGGISWIRGKLADHVGDYVVLSQEEGVLVTSPGAESSYPRLPQSLNNSAPSTVLSILYICSWQDLT